MQCFARGVYYVVKTYLLTTTPHQVLCSLLFMSRAIANKQLKWWGFGWAYEMFLCIWDILEAMDKMLVDKSVDHAPKAGNPSLRHLTSLIIYKVKIYRIKKQNFEIEISRFEKSIFEFWKVEISRFKNVCRWQKLSKSVIILVWSCSWSLYFTFCILKV